jgi:diguanylate cyclase (GGDEF)-like protein
MGLDGQTLFVALVVTSAFAGVLLLWVWLQNKRVRALKWWGLAYLLASLGMMLAAFRGRWPDRLTIDAANGLVFVGYGLMWTGARAFSARRPGLIASLVPAAIWLIACQVPDFYASLSARAIFYSVLCVLVTVAIAREFLAIVDPLPWRIPLAGLMFVHAAFFAVRLVSLLGTGATTASWDAFWVPLTGLEGILFTFACGFLLLALAKSRLELLQRQAAERDYLTEAANRRGFHVHAARRLRHARRAGGPTSVVVFDLDGFKQINDTLGHQSGDRILRLFGRVARDNLRKSDVFGRLGGDEFAALLADTGAWEAREIAERTARRFSETARTVGGAALQVSASIGIAVSEDSHRSLDDLLHEADRALYEGRSSTRQIAATGPAKA